jgi:hypothetical protein
MSITGQFESPVARQDTNRCLDNATRSSYFIQNCEGGWGECQSHVIRFHCNVTEIVKKVVNIGNRQRTALIAAIRLKVSWFGIDFTVF